MQDTQDRSISSTLSNLWQRRVLINTLAVSNLKKSHSNRVLGYLWWLLDPIMMTIVYTLVMRFFRGKQPADPAMAMCGLLTWKAFSSTVGQSITTIAQSGGLIRSYAFPKGVLPIALALSNHFLFLFALIPLFLLVLLLQFVFGVSELHFSWRIIYIPMIFAAQFSLGLGAALLFSCYGVFFRDLSNIMTHVLRVGWWLSPSLYQITKVPALEEYTTLLATEWKGWFPWSIYLLNPFAHIMKAYRDAILWGSTPDLPGIAFAFIIGLVLICVGLHTFKKQERKFAKFV